MTTKSRATPSELCEFVSVNYAKNPVDNQWANHKAFTLLKTLMRASNYKVKAHSLICVTDGANPTYSVHQYLVSEDGYLYDPTIGELGDYPISSKVVLDHAGIPVHPHQGANIFTSDKLYQIFNALYGLDLSSPDSRSLIRIQRDDNDDCYLASDYEVGANLPSSYIPDIQALIDFVGNNVPIPVIPAGTAIYIPVAGRNIKEPNVDIMPWFRDNEGIYIGFADNGKGVDGVFNENNSLLTSEMSCIYSRDVNTGIFKVELDAPLVTISWIKGAFDYIESLNLFKRGEVFDQILNSKIPLSVSHLVQRPTSATAVKQCLESFIDDYVDDPYFNGYLLFDSSKVKSAELVKILDF